MKFDKKCQIINVTNFSHVHLAARQLYLIGLFEILKRDKNYVQFDRLESTTVFSVGYSQSLKV